MAAEVQLPLTCQREHPHEQPGEQEPDHCLICGKPSKAVRKHMRWMHNAELGWSAADRCWTYIYY